jgi:hypothetical protein
MSAKLHIVNIVIWGGFMTALGLMLLIFYWLLIPCDVITTVQPVPVLNEDKTVSVGDRLLLRIDYDKKRPFPGRVAQNIICSSGNMAPIEEFTINLPVGKKNFVFDGVVVPSSMIAGDKCFLQQSVSYKVNPVREITYTFLSEKFTISAAR